MSVLAGDLEAFARGRSDFAGLTAAVGARLDAGDPGSSELMLALSEARDSGVLTLEQYLELLKKVIVADSLAATAATEVEDPYGQTLTFMAGNDGIGTAQVGAGSVIKGRFELESMLGRGGMGLVFKARDRIKVEARDRNPYVAVKILNEDFKAHPESFIALQRECSRTQKLAHPNIATVYDFDRTGPMAYMTMELLEGQPLNEFLATQVPEDGLSFDQAWPIIKGLGDALAHAHERQIVHSDFKPANAFITDAGEVKVLDFGIARAVMKPGHSHTMTFDAGQLGALTPSYASPEMMIGKPPDPRDDIFALGVVAQLLLTRTHPFNRYPADMARAMKLVRPSIPKLSRLQDQALERALAYDRDARTPTVAAFLHELQGEFSAEQKLERQSRLLKIMAAGGLVLIACTIFLLFRAN